MRALGRATRDDGAVKPIYRDNGDGDPEPDPQAVPGVQPETGGDADMALFTLEVDGQMFALRPGDGGGTDYTWLSGPNPGYGFSLSPTPNLSIDEHRENIRDFLHMVDPTTGFIEDD